MTANDAFKKRLKRREDMFLRRLFGILAKMAKADGKVDAWEVHAAEGAFARFPRAAAQIKKATEMMAKINSAWDLIKESRGL